ncbi:MAG TPA: tetratricopeptide repeat protein [Myxococcota bacterium]|nr:tetratricopeptide repeat protein [Myxococcota bacterium]
MTRVRRLAPFLVLAACAAGLYARSLPAPFLFDDGISIVQNENVRALWPLSRALSAPPQTSVAGRPLASLSFAASYTAFGLDPRGWRALNVALHAACALLLFAWLRRALARVHAPEWLAQDARGLAFAVALSWLVHPLATEAVAYVTQRTELLWSAAFLASLYSAERGFERKRAGRSGAAWLAASAASMWLGVGAKEVIVAGPPLLLLYDRAFCSGSFAGSWRRHRALHLATFASWAGLAALVATGPRDATVGFELPISAASYALTQFGVIAWYLRLAFWPAPLLIAHDWPVAAGPGDVWLGLAVVLPLVAATVWACVRRPQLGFAGAWFFGILAPTSSVVPIVSELAAERRMYLPLAAVVAAVVLFVRARVPARLPRAALAGAAALALAAVTALRLEAYREPVELWTQVLARYPEHRLRAEIEGQIGQELGRQGRLPEALPHFERSVELRPDAENLANLGRAQLRQGALDAAAGSLGRAAELAPDEAAVHADLGLVLARLSRWIESQSELERALALDPNNHTAKKALARVLVRRGEELVQAGELAGAVPRFQRAVQLDPEYNVAQQDLISTLVRMRTQDVHTKERL